RSPLKAQTRVRIPLPLCSRPHRLTVRTPLFQGGNRGSIPLGGRGKKGVEQMRHAETSRENVTRHRDRELDDPARRLCVTSPRDVFARRISGSETYLLDVVLVFGPIAQLAEQATLNR